jgi:hypothetical protein
MAVDFTIVTDVRQRFGDDRRDEKVSLHERESGIEADAPFVGLERNFAFRCPSVDRSQFAILLFQSLGVSVRQNLEINGQAIFGGIAPSFEFDTRTLGSGSEAHQERAAIARWIGNVMLIHPGVLQETNILRIRAAEMTAGNADDFVVDNVIVVFKTGRPAVVLDPGALLSASRAGKKSAQKPAKKAAKKAAKKHAKSRSR